MNMNKSTEHYGFVCSHLPMKFLTANFFLFSFFSCGYTSEDQKILENLTDFPCVRHVCSRLFNFFIKCKIICYKNYLVTVALQNYYCINCEKYRTWKFSVKFRTDILLNNCA